MNIVFVNPFFTPWAPGGAEHSLEQLCLKFNEKGWRSTVIAASLDGRCGKEVRDGTIINWLPAPDRITPGQEIPDISYIGSKQYIADVLLAGQGLSERPDIIVANNAQSYQAAVALSRSVGIPALAIIRDTQMICAPGSCVDNTPAADAHCCSGYLGAGMCNIRFHQLRNASSGWRPFPAWFLQGMMQHKKRLDLRNIANKFLFLVTISESLKVLIQNALPTYPVGRIRTIHNLPTIVEPASSEEVQAFFESRGVEQGKYFLFAGRKTYGKGADLAVKAQQIAQRRGMNHQLVMVGRGGMELQQSPGIINEPSVPQNILMALLENAAGLIIPGRWQEGLHRSMVDALRLGIPVICTNVGAPPMDGVQHGQNGLICHCDDAEALALAMLKMSEWDRKKFEECRNIGHDIFNERFSSSVVLDKWEVLFNNVMGHAS